IVARLGMDISELEKLHGTLTRVIAVTRESGRG
ncbi:MAG: hypothetical protein V7646_1061, partial [Pseudonocardia sp.]